MAHRAEEEASVLEDVNTSSLNDRDSAIGSRAGSVRSFSITSSIERYTYENGRRYHAYKDGSYLLPNDEVEQDRLDMQHTILCALLDGLYLAPIDPQPHNVLDFGTGTGIWAIEFAEKHPSAFVIGTDLSPIQPNEVPVNCKFYVEDAEDEWTHEPDKFDYIHGRSMSGCIRDWDMLWQRIYTYLKPGGWVECQEFEWIYSADDPGLEKVPYVKMWQLFLHQATSKFGKKMTFAVEQKQKMSNTGFVKVQGDGVYKIPIGPWEKDHKLKELGICQRELMILYVESTSALFTRVLDWSYQEFQVLFAGVKKDFRNKGNHLVMAYRFYYGQKPEKPRGS